MTIPAYFLKRGYIQRHMPKEKIKPDKRRKRKQKTLFLSVKKPITESMKRPTARVIKTSDINMVQSIKGEHGIGGRRNIPQARVTSPIIPDKEMSLEYEMIEKIKRTVDAQIKKIEMIQVGKSFN